MAGSIANKYYMYKSPFKQVYPFSNYLSEPYPYDSPFSLGLLNHHVKCITYYYSTTSTLCCKKENY